MFFSVHSLTMISSFSSLTYPGSLYLQKKTRISFDSTSGRCCRIRLILRSATHCTSGADETSVTSGGAILRMMERMTSSRCTARRWMRMTWGDMCAKSQQGSPTSARVPP